MVNSRILTIKHLLGSKLAVSGVAIATSAIIGSAGIAAADHMDFHHHKPFNPVIVAKCKAEFSQLGFKNVGQCVGALEHAEHGYGYGGNGNGQGDQGSHHQHGDGDNDQDDQGDQDNQGQNQGQHQTGASNFNSVTASVTNNATGDHSVIRTVLNFFFG